MSIGDDLLERTNIVPVSHGSKLVEAEIGEGITDAIQKARMAARYVFPFHKCVLR